MENTNTLIIFTTRQLKSATKDLFHKDNTKRIEIGNHLKIYWLEKYFHRLFTQEELFQTFFEDTGILDEITLDSLKNTRTEIETDSSNLILRLQDSFNYLTEEEKIVPIIEKVEWSPALFEQLNIPPIFRQIYKYKKENVFAYHHLLGYKNVREDSVPFLNALYQDILDYLNLRNDSNKVQFIVHDKDLGLNVYDEEVGRWCKDLVKKGLEIENLQLLAFKHEPASIIFKILSEFDNSPSAAKFINEKITVFIQEVQDRKEKETEFKKEYFDTIIENLCRTKGLIPNFYDLMTNNDYNIESDNLYKVKRAIIKECAENQETKQEVTKTIYVCFIPSTLLNKQETFTCISESFNLLKKDQDKDAIQNKIKTDIQDENSYQPTPVIFLGLLDIMGVEKKSPITSINLDKRYRFLDSSIWYQYEFFEDFQENSFEERLKKRLDLVAKNYKNRLYESNVAREHCEYHTRLLKEAYLKDVGGHASDITPYVFHSESWMKKEADNLHERIKNRKVIHKKNATNSINYIKWNFLLIDDYAHKQLSIRKDSSNPEKTCKTKTEILEELIGNELIGKLHGIDNIEDTISFLSGISLSKETLKKSIKFLKNIKNSNIKNITQAIQLLKDSEDQSKYIKQTIQLLKQCKIDSILENINKIIEFLKTIQPSIVTPFEKIKTHIPILQNLKSNLSKETILRAISHLRNTYNNSSNIQEAIRLLSKIRVLRFKKNIQEVIHLLSQREISINFKNDIILLDYLFSHSDKKEYGIEFIQQIKENPKMNLGIGPFERY